MAYGDRDVFVPADHAVVLQRQLPDARLLIAPDCGHQVQIERPALFNDAANVFYRTTEKVARERASAGVARQLSRRIGSPGPAAMVLDPTAPLADGEAGPSPQRDAQRDREWYELW